MSFFCFLFPYLTNSFDLFVLFSFTLFELPLNLIEGNFFGIVIAGVVVFSLLLLLFFVLIVVFAAGAGSTGGYLRFPFHENSALICNSFG